MNLMPPEKAEISRVQRHILSEKPRITKFNINWDSKAENEIPSYNNFMFDNMNKNDKQDLFNEQNQNQNSNIKSNFITTNSDNCTNK